MSLSPTFRGSSLPHGAAAGFLTAGPSQALTSGSSGGWHRSERSLAGTETAGYLVRPKSPRQPSERVPLHLDSRRRRRCSSIPVAPAAGTTLGSLSRPTNDRDTITASELGETGFSAAAAENVASRALHSRTGGRRNQRGNRPASSEVGERCVVISDGTLLPPERVSLPRNWRRHTGNAVTRREDASYSACGFYFFVDGLSPSGWILRHASRVPVVFHQLLLVVISTSSSRHSSRILSGSSTTPDNYPNHSSFIDKTVAADAVVVLLLRTNRNGTEIGYLPVAVQGADDI